MSALLVFHVVSHLLALILTLNVLLLIVFWQQWRTSTGWALLQFMASLVLLQGVTLLVYVGLWAGVSDRIVKDFASVAMFGFFLVILTSLALLLHAAQAMKEAWQLVCRSGVAALIVLQPALWKHRLFVFSTPLDETLFGSPYTHLGMLVASLCVGFLILTFYVGWHYWRRIDSPLLSGSVMGIALFQTAALGVGPLRALALTSVAGSVVSVSLGYWLIRQSEIAMQDSRSLWRRSLHDLSQTMMSSQPLMATLSGFAESVRQLVHTDVVNLLLAIGPDRLEVVANAGGMLSMVGRQVRIGEGLAGRVMQTLQPLRVEHYRNWEGRSVDFDDLLLCAGMSIPLIYEGTVVGVINVHEMTSGRVFNDRDQMIIETFAPYIAMTMVTARLQNEVQAASVLFQTVIAHMAAAVLIYESAGILREMNSTAQHYLRLIFGEMVPSPTVIELAARANSSSFTDALVRWTADPTTTYTFETEFGSAGRQSVQLLAVPSRSLRGSDVMVMMRALGGKSPSAGPSL